MLHGDTIDKEEIALSTFLWIVLMSLNAFIGERVYSKTKYKQLAQFTMSVSGLTLLPVLGMIFGVFDFSNIWDAGRHDGIIPFTLLCILASYILSIICLVLLIRKWLRTK